ncbi:MAG: hypothetical protein ABFD60_06985 [Bryobacteraceae bacterium]
MKRIVFAGLFLAAVMGAALGFDGRVDHYPDGMRLDTNGAKISYINVVSFSAKNTATTTATCAGVTPTSTFYAVGNWAVGPAVVTTHTLTCATTDVLTLTTLTATSGTLRAIVIGQ